MSNLRAIGQYAICIRKGGEALSKFEAKCKIARFVNYTDRFNTFEFYDQENCRLFVSCDVKFLPLNYKNGEKEQKSDSLKFVSIESRKASPDESKLPVQPRMLEDFEIMSPIIVRSHEDTDES